MRTSLLVVLALVTGALPAAAFTKAETNGLKSLSGTTRLIQACSLQGLLKIASDKNGYKPEHVVIDALGAPIIDGDKVNGTGGVLRSRGKWYHLSFACATSADHLEVTKFTYEIGEAIPQDQWAQLNLYP